MFRSKDSLYRLASIRTLADELAEKIIREKYTDRGCDVAHAHIWKSATQVSAHVTKRMAQNLEL